MKDSLNTPTLTSTMRDAVEWARDHGGKLHRHPGGFWGGEKFTQHHGEWFGTPTIQGLATRGVVEYTAWKEGANGRFPIEASLTKDWI